jgi:hypothetical protein
MASSKDKKSGLVDLFSLALAQAPDYVACLYAEQPDKRLYFHGFDYCCKLAALVKNAGSELKISQQDAEKLELVAWFYSVGRLFSYDNYLQDSHRLFQEYLKAYDIQPSEIPQLDFFKLQETSNLNEHLLIEILRDALTVIQFGLSDYQTLEMSRIETEEKNSFKYTDEEWDNKTYSELLKNHLCTSWGIKHFSQKYNLKLLDFKQKTYRLPESKPGPKPKKPDRKVNLAAYNFFRIGFRNHIELSGMADNRSHIMISVNSIMMGIMISFITYQNLPSTNPPLLFPVVVFIITGMTSLIFAILAAKPRMWRNINKESSEYEILTHLASYSDFASLSSTQYEHHLDLVLSDPELVKINLKKELYHLGKILDIKNRYLVFSYNVFMFGFLVSMLLFLALLIWV